MEGFFEVCRRRRLSGDQGVIIPKDNLDHLMLKKSLRQAVQDGTFHIYPVEHISHAMELLTGMACGQLRKDGGFTPGSLFQLVDRRLREVCVLGQQPIKKSPAKAHP